jgi:hypothetical protein
LAGDINGDGVVDQADLDILVAHFGQTVPAGTLGDLNGDGTVDLQDFGLLKANWGSGAPAEPAAACGYATYDLPLFDGTPVYSSVKQGLLADCGLLARLAAIAYKDSARLSLLASDDDDRCTVTLYVGSVPKTMTVRKTLPTSGGYPIYAKAASVLWPAVFEKAYAVLCSNSYPKMAARCASARFPLFGYDQSEQWMSQVENTAEGAAFLAGCVDVPAVLCSKLNPKSLIASHIYAILGVSGGTVTLYNPWGYDGLTGSGNPSDGIVEIQASDICLEATVVERACL